LRYPLQPEPVVKVLIPGFKPVPWILGPSSEGRYDTIAAPVDKLRQVARNGRELRYPCIAFVGPNHGLMTGEDRELFWKSFRVPTFEVFLGIHGEVVAEECEAHEGLHVRETTVVESCSGQLAVTSFDCLRTPVARLLIGMSGRMEHRPCACGSSAPRIMDLTMAPVTRAVVAATA
jgi:phenylacetate-coenzyme A ligase PaaK-like adenylate-forming protein